MTYAEFRINILSLLLCYGHIHPDNPDREQNGNYHITSLQDAQNKQATGELEELSKTKTGATIMKEKYYKYILWKRDMNDCHMASTASQEIINTSFLSPGNMWNMKSTF